MDFEQMKKRQIIRVAITEIIMTLAVIFLTFAFVMVVSGYWINSDLEVKQNGFIQISSIPRGATIKIDDDTWFNRTNASQMVSSGEQTVTLSREGYDTWTKKINVSEGVLYQLSYPRLFKLERKKSELLDIKNKKVSFSSDGDMMLLMDGSAIFDFVDLANEKLESKKINMSGVLLSGVQVVDNIMWSENNNRVLLHTINQEWILSSTKKPDYLNLTKEFGLNFSAIKPLDESYDEIIVIENGNLRSVNTNAKSISKILDVNVKKVWTYDGEIFYVTSDKNGNDNIYYLINEEKIKIYEDVKSPQLAFMRFYDEKYLAILNDANLKIYKGDLPRRMTDELNQELVFEAAVEGDELISGLSGNFVMVKNGTRISSLNMEEMKMNYYELESNDFGWLDDYLIYAIQQDGKMIVRDFDGENRREVVVTGANASYPAIIARDKYLYYFTDSQLIREEIY